MDKRPTAFLMAGLPRSGKSTQARKLGLPIVNRDSIRLALYEKPYIAAAEEMISAIEMIMVRALFHAGHSKIIIDACHITKKRRDRWKNPLWKTEVMIMRTSKAECLKRCTNPDLVLPIERMAAETDLILNLDE